MNDRLQHVTDGSEPGPVHRVQPGDGIVYTLHQHGLGGIFLARAEISREHGSQPPQGAVIALIRLNDGRELAQALHACFRRHLAGIGHGIRRPRQQIGQRNRFPQLTRQGLQRKVK